MADRSSSRSRGLPLTFRLFVALVVGSLFLGFVVTELARGHELEQRVAQQEAQVEGLARTLAARAAPLLTARDDLRLAMLSASAAQLADYRVVILDRQGFVVVDTGLSMGGIRQGILTVSGPFARPVGNGMREWLVPAQGLRGFVGEVRVRFPVLTAKTAKVAFSWPLFASTLLASLSLVLVVLLFAHHWVQHVREAASTVQELSRGEHMARCRRRAGGVVFDLQRSLSDLGRSLQEGDNQARSSLVEVAHQMVEMLERRGREGHGERTCRYAMILAARLGLTPEETRDLEQAAQLHDLGEAWLRPSLLDKNGPLNDAERECLKSLPDRGASLLGRLPSLRRVADIIRHHREKYNGGGYPDGLRGERIPLGARILAIADAYDQLTTCATQGHPMGWPDALDKLYEDRGEHFDPWLLDLFEEEIRKAPVPENPMNQVMISPAGVLPYKAVEQEWLIDSSSESEEAIVNDWGEDELDVVGEDVMGEDLLEEDRG